MKKIVHILWRDELLFSPRIINNINDEPDLFDKNRHVFIVASKRLYELCPYSNVVFDSGEKYKDPCIELINKYGKDAHTIIIHSLGFPNALFKIKRQYLDKIIWRTWGHDAIFPYDLHQGQLIQNLVKKILRTLWISNVRRFKAICGANLIDEVNLKEIFGEKIRYCDYPYDNVKQKNVDEISNDNIKQLDIDSSAINVLVGHSGYKNDNHIHILNELKHYSNENIHIYIVLVYGDSEYIRMIKEYLSVNWNNKITVLDKKLPVVEYFSFLSKMDIGIFDGLHSYALDNIRFLIKQKKKLIINKDGIIRKAFEADGVPFLTTDYAFTLSFDEFAKPFEYSSSAGMRILSSTDEKIRELTKVFSL